MKAVLSAVVGVLCLISGNLYGISAVPLDLNPGINPDAFSAYAGGLPSYGASGAYVDGSYFDPDPQSPNGPGWHYVESNMTSSDGIDGVAISWTGYCSPYSELYGAIANCDLLIGTTPQIPAGSPLELYILPTANVQPGQMGYGVAIKRNNTFICNYNLDTTGIISEPIVVDVLAGETLSLNMDVQSLFPSSCSAQLSLWTIPEPTTMALLALGGLAVLRRRK